MVEMKERLKKEKNELREPASQFFNKKNSLQSDTSRLGRRNGGRDDSNFHSPHSSHPTHSSSFRGDIFEREYSTASNSQTSTQTGPSSAYHRTSNEGILAQLGSRPVKHGWDDCVALK